MVKLENLRNIERYLKRNKSSFSKYELRKKYPKMNYWSIVNILSHLLKEKKIIKSKRGHTEVYKYGE